MIIGIGTDLADITRIEKTLERYGTRFLNRVFTPLEQAKAASRSVAAPTLAKRFAAKEACAKALGTGIAHGVYMRDIGVVNDAHGKPGLVLSGGALARLQSLTPAGMRAQIHITITDESPVAAVHVVIEAV